MISHSWLMAISVLVIAMGITSPAYSGDNPRVLQARTNKPFQQTLEDIEFAISERNFRITNTLNIGKGIKERGYENFPENSVVLFCNLKLAKKMLDLDPYYLNHCPYRVTLREIDNQVIINALLLPATGNNTELDQLVHETNNKLRQIVEFGAETWQE